MIPLPQPLMLTLQGCSTMLHIVYLAESFGLGKPAGTGSGGRLCSGHEWSWPWVPVHSQPDTGRVTEFPFEP